MGASRPHDRLDECRPALESPRAARPVGRICLRIKSQRDFASGLIFVAAGITFAVGALYYPLGNSARPGAGFFPLLLSGLMTVLGAVVLIESIKTGAEGGDPIGSIAWRPLGVIVTAIAVFGFALPRLGLFVTVPLLIVISSLAGGEFGWKGVIVNAVVLTIGSWLIFIRGLHLTIPLTPVFLGG